MDIRSGTQASKLSNFHPRKFTFDSVECNSMEGLLQSLKFESHDIQKTICLLVGKKAKFRGKKRNKSWKRNQTLWWKGNSYKRDSIEYQQLLDDMFNALSLNNKFKIALLQTNDAILTHSIGSNDITNTVLTENEFCSRLMKIRNRLKLE